MFILTDGKNYIIENKYKPGEYLSSTKYSDAKEFSYKQAKSFLLRGGKKNSKYRDYQMVDIGTGKEEEVNLNYNGNGGCFLGNKDFDLDETVLDEIIFETNAVLGLSGWTMEQLNTRMGLLDAALSKYDSAESDIEHALEKYWKDNNGKKPQAHKMAKLGYLLEDIRSTRRRIKQCKNYVRVMQDAVTYRYSLSKIKFELGKATDSEYKGRTEYYEIALDLLK